jgi:hypothetical protein
MSPDPSQPASSTPVRDYADKPCPGATADHIVIPRSLAQSMPLRWQQTFVGMLRDLHHAYEHLPWPEFRVVPSRWELLADLDPEQLAAAGYVADIGSDGDLVYRDAGYAVVPDPETRRVLAPVPDPLPPARAGHVDPRPADPL